MCTGSYAFIGNDDYGEMAVNDQSGRLYTGVEVGLNAAVVEVASNSLAHVPMEGGTVAVGVRRSSDHAFLANPEFVAILDGASRQVTRIPVENSPTGGFLVQDVAVNQATGWVYVIPDDDLPLVVAVQDPGGVQQATATPTASAAPSATPTPTPTATTGASPTPSPSAAVTPGRRVHLPLVLRSPSAPAATPTPTATATAEPTPGGGGLEWSGTTSQGHPVRFYTDQERTVVTTFSIGYAFSCTYGGGTGEDTINGSFPISGNTFSIDTGTTHVTGSFSSATTASGTWSKSWLQPPMNQCQSSATWSAAR